MPCVGGRGGVGEGEGGALSIRVSYTGVNWNYLYEAQLGTNLTPALK